MNYRSAQNVLLLGRYFWYLVLTGEYRVYSYQAVTVSTYCVLSVYSCVCIVCAVHTR